MLIVIAYRCVKGSVPLQVYGVHTFVRDLLPCTYDHLHTAVLKGTYTCMDTGVTVHTRTYTRTGVVGGTCTHI